MMVVSAPMLLVVVGMGVEVGTWVYVKAKLQCTADTAALGGVVEYALASNPRNAANAAADVAALNGAAGSTSPTWDSTNMVLSGGQVAVQVTAGVRQRQNTGIKVTVSQTVSLGLTRLMSTAPSITIGATGWADVDAGSQPCILALSTDGVSAQGSVSVTLTGCSVRSNASISTGGGGTISAVGFYANGSITGNETGGALYPNDSTIPDPYATSSTVQAALAKLSPGSGASCCATSKSTTQLYPGTWSNWDIQSDISLAPGIYYVNGLINLRNQVALSGSGVTIVAAGALVANGGASMALSAATSVGAVNGAIPGILFASTSTSRSYIVGNTSPSLTGVVYQPYGPIDFGGTSQGGLTGCLQVIAASVALQGNSGLATSCKDYGTLSFSSYASGTALVR